MKDYKPLEVEKTASRMPNYIRKAQKIKYMCVGGFWKDGTPRKDVGAAVMSNGEIVPFWWGENLSLEEVKEIRQKDKYKTFVYIGRVWDLEKGTRDNFATVIDF